jgi:putative tricarboxylic transport membrane protein
MNKLLSADRIGGLIWFVFGVAVVYGSWMMDRLESMNIPPSTAPGVVPALQGIGFIIFALILMFRAQKRTIVNTYASDDAAAAVAGQEEGGFYWKRILLSWMLCMTYAAVLLGSGIHYWALTVAFLFLHAILLDDTEHVPAKPTLRRIVVAAIMALAISTIVTLIFRYIFLVRLP